MKKIIHKLLKIIKWIVISLLVIILLFLIIRLIGRKINNKTPDGGINETMYVDINNSRQWINIYSENKDNPVLLYLHGGPGGATSYYGDWIILRKLAKDYTVINWDQRNCGKSWIEDPQDTEITPELLRSDLLEMTNYLLNHFGKNKITIFGVSWGSIYGADFAQNHPELVECFIGGSMIVDFTENAKALREFFLKWSADDPEYKKLAEKFDPLNKYTDENDEIMLRMFDKYVPQQSLNDGDVNMTKAFIFNPYYSLGDLYKVLFKYPQADNGAVMYDGFDEKYLYSGEFTVKNKNEYEMPVYFIEGNIDYAGGYTVAEDYLKKISAPDKELRYVEGGHIAPMIQTKKLAEFVHEIAQKQKNRDR